MPAFTAPAALRRLSRTGSLRATAASTTVPPVDTATTTTSPDCEVTTSASAPTSPLLPVENESIVLKAVRAYERDRQRAKKTKERSERERERQRTTAAAADPTSCRHCRDASGTARRSARAGAGAVTKGDMAAGVLTPPGPGTPFVEEVIADVVERETLARGALEVHLAQLVKPAKARRSKAGEFEIVPSMPVVIALDDRLASEDAELDEPWEHISADELDEKRAEPPSYATVVASTI